MARIDLGDVRIEVVRKEIKNLHLSVLPPKGKVRISAPKQMKLDTIRVFVIAKLEWIRRQQRKMQAQERETPREYLDRESHYVWGRRYMLGRVEKDSAPSIEVKHNRLVLQVRPDSDEGRCRAVLENWYREQLRAALPPLLEKWEPAVGVKIERVFVQRMKTKWGGCNPMTRSIRLNTDLAKKPLECLEYILVHEMAHIIEPSHNVRFTSLMDLLLPHWRDRRRVLNQLPVRHEEWDY